MAIRVEFHPPHPPAETACIGRPRDIICSSVACLLFPPQAPIDVGQVLRQGFWLSDQGFRLSDRRQDLQNFPGFR
jgi:hypothetical protein